MKKTKEHWDEREWILYGNRIKKLKADLQSLLVDGSRAMNVGEMKSLWQAEKAITKSQCVMENACAKSVSKERVTEVFYGEVRIRTQNQIILEVGAWCYGNALFTHFDVKQEGFDTEAYDYVCQQLQFVRCHAAEVAEFLRHEGVDTIDEKHLQYFFAILPLFKPYQRLWRFCFERMNEEGLLPTNGAAILSRMLRCDANANRRYFNIANSNASSKSRPGVNFDPNHEYTNEF